jgi:HEPN superfamily AbiU2-like protein
MGTPIVADPEYLFDNKSSLPVFQQPRYEHFFFRLSIILQEYWMQQVAKLHDPAGWPGQHNLSVDYMIECGDWDDGTKARLIELRGKILPFAAKMKTPRNKLFAHNDVATILSAAELGAFDEGGDVEYFKDLKAFTEIVVSAVLGEHFDYDVAVDTDVALFVEAFDRGRIS